MVGGRSIHVPGAITSQVIDIYISVIICDSELSGVLLLIIYKTFGELVLVSLVSVTNLELSVRPEECLYL